MKKETAIKVSKEFKNFIFDKKEEGEDLEATIKRLIMNPVNRNTSVNPMVNCQYKEQLTEIPSAEISEIPPIKEDSKIEMKIFPSSLPKNIEEKFNEAKKESVDPLNNAPIEKPDFEDKILPAEIHIGNGENIW